MKISYQFYILILISILSSTTNAGWIKENLGRGFACVKTMCLSEVELKRQREQAEKEQQRLLQEAILRAKEEERQARIKVIEQLIADKRSEIDFIQNNLKMLDVSWLEFQSIYQQILAHEDQYKRNLTYLNKIYDYFFKSTTEQDQRIDNILKSLRNEMLKYPEFNTAEINQDSVLNEIEFMIKFIQSNKESSVDSILKLVHQSSEQKLSDLKNKLLLTNQYLQQINKNLHTRYIDISTQIETLEKELTTI